MAAGHPVVDPAQGWQSLFNGKDLTGWTVRDVLFDGSRVVGVRADVKAGARGEEPRATPVVDASGRDSLPARKGGRVDPVDILRGAA